MKTTHWRTSILAVVALAAAGCATLDNLPGAPLTDDEKLAARAEELIRRDAGLGSGSVSVDVFRGVATLEGVVDGEAGRRRVLNVLEGVEGIDDVRDHLRVR